jgi:hypothetical protein
VEDPHLEPFTRVELAMGAVRRSTPACTEMALTGGARRAIRVLAVGTELDLVRHAGMAVVGRARDYHELAPAAAATAAGERALGIYGPESTEPRVGAEVGERPMCAAGVRSAGRGGTHEGRERTVMARTTWGRRV